MYLVPYYCSVYLGQITRYDTTLPFTSASSYSVFDITTLNANCKGLFYGVYDGKFVYLIPYNNGSVFGQITRILANETLYTNVNTVKPQLSLQYSVNDAIITTPSVGDLLQYNGTKWVNATTQSLTITDNSSVVHTIKVIVTA